MKFLCSIKSEKPFFLLFFSLISLSFIYLYRPENQKNVKKRREKEKTQEKKFNVQNIWFDLSLETCSFAFFLLIETKIVQKTIYRDKRKRNALFLKQNNTTNKVRERERKICWFSKHAIPSLDLIKQHSFSLLPSLRQDRF